MAATINDRDIILAGTSPRTETYSFGTEGEFIGLLDGHTVTEVVEAAFTDGGSGDDTIQILQNSGTTITVSSSVLFQMLGSGLGGTFIGGGGIIGRDSTGQVKVTINSNTGLLTAEDAVIKGTLTAGSIITNSVQIGGTGISMQNLIDGMGGGTFDLQGALDAGVENILAGVGSNYRLNVDTSNAFISLQHKDAVYRGTASPGSDKPAIGISSAGIAMGYNRASDGQWINAVAIDATGNATFAGTVAANSIIAQNVLVSGTGTTMLDLVNGIGGTFDLQGALNSGVEDILAGVGGDYRLEVSTGTGLAVFRHKDSVYGGTASPGSNKFALGISAAGIGMGFNRASDGAWVNSVAINSSGNASFAGTIAANSVIAQNVVISGTGTSMLDLVNGMGGTFDLQGALDAGVGNILAGVGSNYRLNIDTANAFISLQHKDAVYNGTASGGSNKPAIGISSAGIAMGYNRASDGAWVNGIAIDATGNASFAGTVAANSIIAQNVMVSGTGTTMLDLVNGIGGTFDLQGALNSGVEDILAGVGGDYRLEVSTGTGLAVFRHKDSVYGGTASGGSNKFALGISAAGIGMGFNRASDGQWVNSVAINSSGNASFAGTVAAGSIIAQNVMVSGTSTTMLDLVNGIGGTFDLQGALDAGVGKVLAGVGSDYRLDVDTVNAFVAFRHKDAVYKGTASSGSNKPAIGISSTGIAMGYNRSSDGQWVNSVAIDSSGNASFAGTISANSVIAQSVLVSGTGTTMMDLVNGIGGTFDLDGALAAGVGKVLAGVGSNYVLDVDVAGAFVSFRHKDAVYKGTAAPGSIKPAIGLSAAGIAMGYNRASDGAWVDGVAINSSGNATFSGTIAANSIISNSVTVNGIPMSTISANAMAATSNYFSSGSGNPSGGSDGDAYWNTSNSTMWFNIGGTWTRGGTVNANQITTGTLAAARIASNSITSDKINVSTLSAIAANLGTVNAGNITGSANINISGQARFDGETSQDGSWYAMVVNSSGQSAQGIVAYTSDSVVGTNLAAVTGLGRNGNVAGRFLGPGGTQVIIGASNGSPIAASGGTSSFSGISTQSLSVFGGGISTTSTALVTNLNADRLDNYHASSFCSLVGCNSGSATVSGQGFNLNVQLSGIRSRGSGNTVFVEATPSDIRLKTDIDYNQVLGLEYLNKIQTISFKYIDSPDRVWYGLPAQQVRSALDDMGITGDQPLHRVDNDGWQSVDLIAHVVPLIKAVQELSQKIENLENGI